MENVEKMTIAEVVNTPEFRNQMHRLVKQMGNSRLKAANSVRNADQKLKAHPIDRLIMKDEFTPDKMCELFMLVIDKQCFNHSAAERNLIERIGMEAFTNTMKAEIKRNPELKGKMQTK